MQSLETDTAVTTAPPEPHERGIWRGAYVVYNLVLLGGVLAVGGMILLAVLVLAQGSLVGVLCIPLLTWAIGALTIGAVYAVHDQDLTADIQPVRRMGRGLRHSTRQAAVLWIPAGAMIALVLAASILQGRSGPDAPGLVLLAAICLVALLGSVIAARFTAGGVALWRYALGAVAYSGRGALGVLLVALACALMVAVIGEWVLIFVAAPVAVLLDRSAKPLVVALEEALERTAEETTEKAPEKPVDLG